MTVRFSGRGHMRTRHGEGRGNNAKLTFHFMRVATLEQKCCLQLHRRMLTDLHFKCYYTCSFSSPGLCLFVRWPVSSLFSVFKRICCCKQCGDLPLVFRIYAPFYSARKWQAYRTTTVLPLHFTIVQSVSWHDSQSVFTYGWQVTEHVTSHIISKAQFS